MMSRYLIGFLVSVVAAIPATYLWSVFLHRMIERHRQTDDKEATRIHWIPLTVGILERILFTVLVGWNVTGAAGFIGSWVLVKQLGGWNSWGNKGTTYSRAVFFVGLLGNAMSVLFGVVGGLIIFSK
jgi:hypothetical protein